ncbi:putative ribonuclease H-like domain-containing protein, partial [Tanacetum coccineum]
MADLTFADSHNMVAYLEKLEDNVDFAEIVDFLNASPIRRDLHFDDEDGITCLTNTEKNTKKVIQALTDPSWIEAIQDKLLQFKLQQVWTLVDLPYDKRAIGTKWIYRNKKDERGIMVRNKARLVAQDYTQ